MMAAVSQFPGTVEHIVNAYDQAVEDDKLTDVLIGYLDPTDDVPSAAQVQNRNDSDSDDDEERKPTRGLILRRRGALRGHPKQLKKTERNIKRYGRDGMLPSKTSVRFPSALPCSS